MNLAALRAGLARNKAGIGVLGAAVVAALALRARSGKASSSAEADASPAGTGATSYGAGFQTSAATGYDSTASDVYGAIQPQIETLQRLLEAQQNPGEETPAAPVYKYGDARRDTIAGYYQAILGRDPDTAGLDGWDRTGASLEVVRKGILDSPEAKGRK